MAERSERERVAGLTLKCQGGGAASNQSVETIFDIQDMGEEEAAPVESSFDVGEGATAGEATAGEHPEQQDGDELLCPICLDTPKLEDLAIVKGCEHVYCVKCILHWATHKEQEPWCPQCKKPFNYLVTYRSLDGTLNDYPVEESVCLLKRACWFQEHMRANEKGKGVMVPGDEWDDYSRFYDEYDEDQEVEDYYFSAAAGHARVTIGNRRWGDGGYVSSGRRAARPVVPKSNTPKGKAVTPNPPQPASHKQLSASPASASSSSYGAASHSPADRPGGKGQGRRARRNARRTVHDDYDDC